MGQLACRYGVALSRAKLEWQVFGDAESAREIFTKAAAANPSNFRVLQAWGVMEMRNAKPRGSGLSAARPLFARAADLAPWSPWVGLYKSNPVDP
jgi:hypothetical protein